MAARRERRSNLHQAGAEGPKAVLRSHLGRPCDAPGDPDGPGLPDLFHDAVEGLWPDDFEWMFLGVAGRSRTRDDLVVDLEKATAEVLSFQNRARKPADHSPHWGGPGVVLEEPRDDR